VNGNGSVIVEVSARTDVGQTREHNEDTFLVADLTRGTTDFLESGKATIGPRGSLFLVADGMGGAAAGEIASAMAADVIFEQLRASWTPAANSTPEEFTRLIRDAVEVANDRIHQFALDHPESRGMGTTATVAGVFGPQLYLAQVGDSRAYLVRGGEAVQITKDQSLMQRLIDAGELTEEQAAQSERRNIILQALGPDAKIRVDITSQGVARGDLLLLCSDGLSGQLNRHELGPLVAECGTVEAICDRLIALANERGGPDNITAVVVRFDGAGLPEADGGAETPGYHRFSFAEFDSSGEAMVVTAINPAVLPPEPAATTVMNAVERPAPPAEAVPPARNGSPVIVAAVGATILLILLALFFVFA
jgi:protein phosphatase